MKHPTEDQLLLHAYGELAEPHAIEAHVAACGECAQQLAQLERGRVALDIAVPARRSTAIVWSTVALAAAAALAAVVITKFGPSHQPAAHWTPTTTWSTTAGYVTGGKPMMDIDVQLTRLEQGRYYGLPN
jgi:anti-sigma factor ChrR (cupin superfamily)